MKQWIDWDDEDCDCGGSLQVLTSVMQDEFSSPIAHQGDLVRCRECYCLGWIEIDEHDWPEVQWPMDMCAKCWRERLSTEILMRRAFGFTPNITHICLFTSEIIDESSEWK